MMDLVQEKLRTPIMNTVTTVWDRLTRADYLKGLITEHEAFTMDDLGNRQSTRLRDGSGDTYAVDALTNRYDALIRRRWPTTL